MVEESLKNQNLTITEQLKPPGATWGLKWLIQTGKKFEIKQWQSTWDGTLHSIDGATVDLDKDAVGLYMTLGQSGGSTAHLDWTFHYTTGWGMTVIGAGAGGNFYGDVKITNTLNKDKTIDSNSDLPIYKVALDLSFTKSDWDIPKGEAIGGGGFFGGSTWAPSFAPNAQPDLPSFNFNLFDFNFFLTTNLLLPTSDVIKFDVTPGIRMPRDLYIVGHVAAPPPKS